jgi:hypothetical protein
LCGNTGVKLPKGPTSGYPTLQKWGNVSVCFLANYGYSKFDVI